MSRHGGAVRILLSRPEVVETVMIGPEMSSPEVYPKNSEWKRKSFLTVGKIWLDDTKEEKLPRSYQSRVNR